MAKIDFNGITVEEISRNANNSYAASISSGEIFQVACRHSKSGNILLVVEGKALTCKGFDGNTFIADGCILYNPPLTRQVVEACDDSNNPIFIVGGAVTTTAPASKPTTDAVISKEELKREKEALQAKYFSLKGAEKEAAEARLTAIETALKA